MSVRKLLFVLTDRQTGAMHLPPCKCIAPSAALYGQRRNHNAHSFFSSFSHIVSDTQAVTKTFLSVGEQNSIK